MRTLAAVAGPEPARPNSAAQKARGPVKRPVQKTSSLHDAQSPAHPAPDESVHVRLQRKLAVGAVADPLEYEADNAADAAMGGRVWHPRCPYTPPVTEAPPVVHRVLRSPGQALDSDTRGWAERAFDRDFSRVRIHRGQEAELSAASVQARAYTVGSSIVFGRDSARSGLEYRHLIAHELAHVVQQGAAAPLAHSQAASEGAPSSTSADGTGAASPSARQRSSEVAQRPAAVGLLQRTPDTRGKDLGFLEEGLVTVAASPARVMGETVYGLMRATWHGFMAELDEGAGGAFEKAKSRAIDFIKSPKQIALFPFKYAWGLVKGIFSPITGLFDLAKLAYHLEEIGRKLVSSVWEHSEQVAASASDLAAKMRNLGNEAAAALKSFMDHPVESVKGMLPLLDGLGDQATSAAEEGGHKIGNMLLGSVDQPVGDLAETAGEVIGTVVVNVALFVLTDGIGDALLQIAVRLGEVGKALSAGGKMAEALGTVLRFLGGAIGKVGGWIAKLEGLIAKAAGAVLKPLAPVLEKFGEVMGSLRTFLRDLLGVAERAEATEAEAAARTLAKQEADAARAAPRKASPPPADKPAAKVAPAKPTEHASGASAGEQAAERPAVAAKHSEPPEAKTPVHPPPRPRQPPPVPRQQQPPVPGHEAAPVPGEPVRPRQQPPTRPAAPPRVRGPRPMTQEELDRIPWADDVGLSMRGLSRTEAYSAYTRWIAEDPLREVAVYRSLQGEYIVIQGKTDAVGAMQEIYDEAYVVLVEHYHPGADPLARIASEADFGVMMHGQWTGNVPPGATSTRVRWKDPVSGVDKLTEIGFRPGRPDPYYIKFEELDGRMVERTFRDHPWQPGSDYQAFVRSRYPAGTAPHVLPPPTPPPPRARAVAGGGAPPPMANAPVRPVRGSGPAPTVQTAPGIRPELRTAQTGGIKNVRQARDVFGLETTSIDTEMQAGMNRAKAPNYNKLWSRGELADEVSRSLVQAKGMTQAQAKAAAEALANNYEAAHVVGPGFGDEAAAGMMWAPRDVNQKMQNRFAEKFARDLEKAAKPMGGTVETTVSVVPFEPDVLRARGLPADAKFLEHAQYEITLKMPDQAPRSVRITVTSQPPGPNAIGGLEFDPPELASRFLQYL